MDILTIGLGVASLVGVVVLRLIATEIQDWMPWLARRIIDRTVANLPEHERERYREEWYAHSNECPGRLAKIFHAMGCAYGARAVASTINQSAPKKVRDPTRTKGSDTAASYSQGNAEAQADLFRHFLLEKTDDLLRLPQLDLDRFDYLWRDEFGQVTLIEFKSSNEFDDVDVLRRLKQIYPRGDIRRLVGKKSDSD